MKNADLALSSTEIEQEKDALREWKVAGRKKLRRDFEFRTFMDAINFIKIIAETSEKINHHPDISIFYNKVRVEIFTHKINGLTRLDFILAKRIEYDFQKQTGSRQDAGGKTGRI